MNSELKRLLIYIEEHLKLAERMVERERITHEEFAEFRKELHLLIGRSTLLERKTQ